MDDLHDHTMLKLSVGLLVDLDDQLPKDDPTVANAMRMSVLGMAAHTAILLLPYGDTYEGAVLHADKFCELLKRSISKYHPQSPEKEKDL